MLRKNRNRHLYGGYSQNNIITMERNQKYIDAEKLLERESLDKCRELLALAKNLQASRKYCQAQRKISCARNLFPSYLVFSKKQEYRELEDEIEGMYKSLEDKRDEPEKFPRQLSLDKITELLSSSMAELIGLPFLISEDKPEDLPTSVGLFIEESKDINVRRANAFAAGEGEFNGTTKNAEDNWGNSYREIVCESYIFPVQLYRLK